MPNIQQPLLTISLGVNAGELECRIASQPGMKSVNFYSTTNPAALTGGDGVNWTVTASNTVKATLTGLESGVRCYAKAGIIGVRGQEVFSAIVSFVPQ